jgi:ATP-binding cassette, subfamily C, bacterial LapB
MHQLLARLRAKPFLALELFTASLCLNVLALTPPLFFILVFNKYVSSGFDGTLITLSAGMLLAVTLKSLFSLARNRLAEDLTGDQESRHLHHAFLAVLKAKAAQLRRLPAGEVMEAIQGPQHVQAASSPQNIGALLDAPFAVLSVLLVFLLSFQLGLATLFGLILTVLLSMHGQRAMRVSSREMGEHAGAGRQIGAQALRDCDTVRMFGCQGFMLHAWETRMQGLRAARQSAFRGEGFSQVIMESSSLVLRAVIIALGARLVVHGQLTVGAVIGASFLAGLPLGIATRFIRARTALHSAEERTRPLALLTGLDMEPEQGLAVKTYAGGLELIDAAFAWPGAPGPLFESVSLRLPPGAFLAVTGRNGTGKTTLARMIAGLLEPGRGQLMVNGLDLRQVAPAWWRRQLIYLPQEPAFVRASILENIQMANPELETEGVQDVIDQAGLRPFLNAHPLGASQILEESGRLLSPGVRKRLALARALAVNGPLAVLDEPTEALDREGCRTMLRILKQLAANKKTVIVFSNDMHVLNMAEMFLDLNVKPVPAITGAGSAPGELP